MNQGKKYSELDILNYAIQQDIISVDAMLEEIEIMERKQLLKQHPYAITTTINKKTGKEFYSTYLPTEQNTRIYRRRNSLKELEDLVITFYKEKEEKIFLSSIYYQWINAKYEYGEIQKATYDRYNNDFIRYFINYNHPILQKQIKHISEDDIESFIKSVIRDLALSRKAYAGLRTLIRGIFKYAKKRKLTNISITEFFGDIDLPKNMFRRKIVDKEKEVFMEDEISLVTSYLREHADIFNLGILLVFETGLRVGELSTLKATDINGQMLRIRRTEDKYRDEKGKWIIEVKEHAKTEAGNRDLIIPSSALTTLRKILSLNPNGNYLFENNGKRIRGNTFNKRLSLVCKKLNIPHRSIHKVRKTYGTMLIDNDVDESFITEQMGHSDISTTKKLYYFSNKTSESKIKQIEKAISF